MDQFSMASLLDQLYALGDEKYKAFNDSLIPGVEQASIGVRLPKLREIAKELCRTQWQQFLTESASSRIHEVVLLRGLVIAGAPCSYETRLQLLAEFIPTIENWAVCDCVCSSLKSAKKHLPETMEFLAPYLRCREEFQLRFAVVMLMDYFVTPEYIDQVLEILKQIRHQGYYVNMAVAWALSVCFVKFRDQTLALLSQRILPPWVQNKAIQKCRESRRVTEADKALLLQYKEDLS